MKKNSKRAVLLLILIAAVSFFRIIVLEPEDRHLVFVVLGYSFFGGFVVFLTIIVHELGHLVFGLLSGYEFDSIQFFNFVLSKNKGGYQISRVSMRKGIAGQCLMRPPAYENFKFFLYNAGGVIFNVLFAVVLILLNLFVLPKADIMAPSLLLYLIPFMNRFILYLAAGASIFIALMNWLPLKYITNDGNNWRAFKKREDTQIALYYELLINSELNRNKRLSELDLSELEEATYTIEDSMQALAFRWLYLQAFISLDFDDAYLKFLKYKDALLKIYDGILPYEAYLDYYLLSLAYYEDSISMSLSAGVKKLILQKNKDINVQMIYLLENYYGTGRILDKEKYDSFLLSVSEERKQGLALDYEECLQHILFRDKSYDIRPVDLETIWKLRHDVMWPNESLDFIKVEGDEEADHYGLFLKDNLISIVSVFENEGEFQFRKFATKERYQSLGYGSKLLNYILVDWLKSDAEVIFCNARIEKKDFYENFELKQEGKSYKKNGQEYIKMYRRK